MNEYRSGDAPQGGQSKLIAFFHFLAPHLIRWPGKVLFVAVSVAVMAWFIPGGSPGKAPRPEMDGIVFVGEQYDRAGNLMELFRVGKVVDKWELVQFCHQLKSRNPACNFYLAAFFKDRTPAVFPVAEVMTGGYSLNDEKDLTGLIGEYTYCNRNNYSNLRHSLGGTYFTNTEEIPIR